MIPHRLPLTLTACCLASALATSQEPIRWRTGATPAPRTDTLSTQAVLFDGLLIGERHYVLQLDEQATRKTRQTLAAAGVDLQTPLGGNAWFAAVRPMQLDPVRLAAVSKVIGIQRVQRDWKMHPLLAAGELPEYARVEESEPSNPTVAVYAVFHPDALVQGDVPRQLVEKLEGRVMDTLETINGMVVELPLSRLGELADADVVQWLEPPLPPMSDVMVNDSNRSRVQADVAQSAPYNLDGSGVSVMVYDGGYARESHNDFGGRLTVRDSSGLSDHATHVAGTIGGSGASSGGTYAGMAPGATLESYGLQTDGSSIFLYTNPGDLESDYNQAINTYGADISNNSIGTNTEINGFPCNIQGDYGVCSSVIDSVARGSLGAPFRIVWANGNERQGTSCNVEGHGDYYSTAPPATAKNHITVGALNSNNDSMTSFSSWGPTDDGRIKPDISAPGCQSNSDGGVTSPGSSNDNAVTVKCGTSMASPTVAGCVALLLEDYRNQFPGADPPGSLVKILLAQEAVDLGDVGPDYEFGYGSVRIRDTIDFMRLGRFDQQDIDDHGASYVYSVSVPGGTSELKVTIAWDDVPGTPNVAGALVNDLDLRVIAPGGTQHFPWTLNPANPGAPAVRTTADHVNNIEQVLVDNPVAGTWRVEVHGYNVPSGPQPFSIVSSHDLTAGPFVQIGFPAGVPATTAPGSAETIQARVEGVGEALVGGSATLNYRYDGGSFVQLPMAGIGGDLFEATLPTAYCSDSPEFYVSADGASSGSNTSPPDAPATAYAFDVEDSVVVFADDFETNTGWSVTNTSITDGAWERGIPAGDGGRSDPLTDFDGSGRCYLTDNVSGNSDVDGGPTTVTSPLIDMSVAGTYVVRYALWFGNNDFDADDLDVEVSSNGGSSWTAVESFQNTSGWIVSSFNVSDFVSPSSTMRVRFHATDNPNDSITEAALDAFEVRRITCDVDPTPTADFTASPTGGQAPLLVTFTDTSAGSVDTWTWDFGDGGGATVQHPSHTYDLPGTYTVTLDVSGAFGSDGETKVGYVTAAKPPMVGTIYGTGTPGTLGEPTIAAHSDLTPGAAFFLVGGNLPPGSAAFLALSQHAKIPPIDLTNGLLLNVNIPLLLLAPVTTGTNGEAILPANIPAVASGLTIHGQCFALDGTGGNDFCSSMGVQVQLP
ncbi:MAG: S8 family serine peptidase [Planctomycetota bacterium]